MIDPQGRRKYLKLGRAWHFEDIFSLRKRGHFLRLKRALICFCKILGEKWRGEIMSLNVTQVLPTCKSL